MGARVGKDVKAMAVDDPDVDEIACSRRRELAWRLFSIFSPPSPSLAVPRIRFIQ